jgi:2-haloacid dehalogenase
MHRQLRAWVFDAYGTLFDPFSLQGKAERIFSGRGEVLSQLWRSRQLEYTWLRALMNHYVDFWQVTREAFVYACHSLGLRCEVTHQDELMQEYLHLETYPDVTAGIEALLGQRLAILSNGSPRMLEAVVEHAGLKSAFAALISADKVRTYKPSLTVYQLAVEALELRKGEIGFVSSNYWDVKRSERERKSGPGGRKDCSGHTVTALEARASRNRLMSVAGEETGGERGLCL